MTLWEATVVTTYYMEQATINSNRVPKMTPCQAEQAMALFTMVLKATSSTVAKVMAQPCPMAITKKLQLLILAAVSFKFQRVKKLTKSNTLIIFNPRTKLSLLNN